MKPLLIPVLDLRGGVVVHAVAGQRSEYRPLKSLLANTTEPLEVLQQVRAATGLETFYVADLDGIIDGRPDWKMLQRLTDTGVRLLIDAGARRVGDIDAVRLGRNVRPVVGTESFEELDRLLSGTSADVVCSLDLHAGRLRLADQSPEAGQITVESLAEQLWTAGLRSWIVLDTAAVGTGRGIPTLPLCRTLHCCFPGVELISGGGVRSQECLQEAGEAGVSGVLVASALHAGALWSFLRA
ncbi:MAG: HisA/HisF-related TIM barrel protein [Planctomycetaceae bacterium]